MHSPVKSVRAGAMMIGVVSVAAFAVTCTPAMSTGWVHTATLALRFTHALLEVKLHVLTACCIKRASGQHSRRGSLQESDRHAP